jgi:hypothetical protein
LTGVLSALLLFFVLAEGALRLRAALNGTAPDHPDRSLQREWNWAMDHLTAGASILPGLAIYDPDLGWVTKPSLTNGSFRTNSVGMRSSREFSIERVPGTPRILFVGDSYTFGSQVKDEETFTWVLEQEFLSGWEMLNLGVPGYGPDQALLMFEKLGAQYRPDIVVFGFYVRSFFRLFSDFRSYAKPYFVLVDGNELDLRGVPIISPADLYGLYVSGERRIPTWNYSYLFGTWGSLVRQALENRHLGTEHESWQLMAAILRRFRDRTIQAGSQPFLLIIPDRPERYPEAVFEAIDQLAQQEARDLGIPFLSLAKEFQDEWSVPPDEYRPKEDGGHLSAHGHRLVATLLYQSLQDADLLSAEPSPGSTGPSR